MIDSLPSGSLASEIGPQRSVTITKHYRKGTVVRRYREAIEDGIGEDELVADLRWMLAEAKQEGNLNAMLKVWRFIMEYTVGKPVPMPPDGANMTVTIMEALERGAEYMQQFAPEPGELVDEDSRGSEAVGA